MDHRSASYLADGPLPEKYLTRCNSAGSSQSDSMTEDVSLSVGQLRTTSSLSSLSAASDRQDSTAIGFDRLEIPVEFPPPAGGWGSADSGLNYLGKLKTPVERSRTPIERTLRAPRTPRPSGSFSDRKCRQQPSWLPVNTENVLAKVRELLGDQSVRDKMSGIVEAQRARRRSSLDDIRLKPLKVPHTDTKSDGSAQKLSNMGLEAQVLFNLERKNRQNDVSRQTTGDRTENEKLEMEFDPERFVHRRQQAAECNWRKGLGSLTFASSRSSDTVPTAHVTPSLLSQSRGVGSHHHHHQHQQHHQHSTSNLRHNYHSDEALHRSVPSPDSGMDRLCSQSSAWRSTGISSEQMTGPEHVDFQPLTLDCEKFGSNTSTQRSTYYDRLGDPMWDVMNCSSGNTAGMARSQESAVGSSFGRNASCGYDGGQTMDRQYGFGDELSSWEQQHQQLLLKQQMEMAGTSSMFRSPHSVVTGLREPSQSVASRLVEDSHKLDSVKRAANNIIKEKDMIIERQKLKILELELNKKELERNQHTRLQDAEADNVLLTRQLTERNIGNSSYNQLEDKLGAAEHKIELLKEKLQEHAGVHEKEFQKLLEKVKEKDELVDTLKEECNTLKKSNEDLHRKLKGMKRFFADLPTTDELKEKAKELKCLEEENASYKQQVTELEKKLSDAQKGLSSRDALIKSLEDNVRDMEKDIEKLKARNTTVQDKLNQGGSNFDDLEELQYENTKLKSELEKYKKIMERKQKKEQQLEAHYKKEITELKERLSQEESAVVALRDEMLTREHHLKKLRQSFKEISSQNQDLIDANMALKDQIKEAERQTQGEIRKLEKVLIKELSICFNQLNKLVNMCVQAADRKEIDVSDLIGTDVSSEDVCSELDCDNRVKSLKTKMAKTRQLRDELDKLQHIIINKYAEDMGSNFTGCATQ